MYVTSEGSSDVAVIDTKTRKVLARIKTGPQAPVGHVLEGRRHGVRDERERCARRRHRHGEAQGRVDD